MNPLAMLGGGMSVSDQTTQTAEASSSTFYGDLLVGGSSKNEQPWTQIAMIAGASIFGIVLLKKFL